MFYGSSYNYNMPGLMGGTGFMPNFGSGMGYSSFNSIFMPGGCNPFITSCGQPDYKAMTGFAIAEGLMNLTTMCVTDAINDKRFLDLINDIYYNYSFCYTTNTNFINDVNINKTCEVLYLSNVVVTSPFHDGMEINASEISGSLWANKASKELCNLNKGEIIMHYVIYLIWIIEALIQISSLLQLH